MEEEAFGEKYKRLVVEYAKLKSHSSVLKEGVRDAQAETEKLNGALSLLRQKNRVLVQENDALAFNNTRLTQRVAALTTELQARPKSSSWWPSSSKSREAELEAHINVLEEHLGASIAAAEDFGKREFELARSHAEEVATLNGHVMALTTQLDQAAAAHAHHVDEAQAVQEKLEDEIKGQAEELRLLAESYSSTLQKLAALQGDVTASLKSLNDSHFGGVAPFYYPLAEESSELELDHLGSPIKPDHESSRIAFEETVDALVSGLESSFMAFQASAIALSTPDRSRGDRSRSHLVDSPATPSRHPARRDQRKRPAKALSPADVQSGVQHALLSGHAFFSALGQVWQTRAGAKNATPKLATLAGQSFSSLASVAAPLGQLAELSLDALISPEASTLTEEARLAATSFVGALKKALPFQLALLRVEAKLFPDLKPVNNSLGPLFATVAAALEALASYQGSFASSSLYPQFLEPLSSALSSIETCVLRADGLREIGDSDALLESVRAFRRALDVFDGLESTSGPTPGGGGKAEVDHQGEGMGEGEAPVSSLSSPMVRAMLNASAFGVGSKGGGMSDTHQVIALKAQLRAKDAQLAAALEGKVSKAVVHNVRTGLFVPSGSGSGSGSGTGGEEDDNGAYDADTRLRLHYEGKVLHAEQLLAAADARAGEMYQRTVRMQAEVDETRRSLESALQAVDAKTSAMAAMEADLEATRRNYEEQLNTLTNHIVSLNATSQSSPATHA